MLWGQRSFICRSVYCISPKLPLQRCAIAFCRCHRQGRLQRHPGWLIFFQGEKPSFGWSFVNFTGCVCCCCVRWHSSEKTLSSLRLLNRGCAEGPPELALFTAQKKATSSWLGLLTSAPALRHVGVSFRSLVESINASSVPWVPRRPMAPWGALGGVWAAGRGRFSSPSALPWGGPICSAVSSAGLPSSRKMRSYWRESSAGLQG